MNFTGTYWASYGYPDTGETYDPLNTRWYYLRNATKALSEQIFPTGGDPLFEHTRISAYSNNADSTGTSAYRSYFKTMVNSQSEMMNFIDGL